VSPFASGLAGRLFGGHRAAARSSSSATAVFERRFASAGKDHRDHVYPVPIIASRFRSISLAPYPTNRVSVCLFVLQRPKTRTMKSSPASPSREAAPTSASTTAYRPSPIRELVSRFRDPQQNFPALVRYVAGDYVACTKFRSRSFWYTRN
jgi:hypothetical protein